MNVRELMARDHTLAEHYLINYDAEQKRYAEELADHLTREKSEVGGGRGGVGDPTGSLAVKRVEFERKSEAFHWLDAVRSVEDILVEHERKILRWRREFDRGKQYRRGRGRPAWVINAVARFSVEDERVVSDFTVRKIWSNMVRLVVFAKYKRW